MILGGIEMNRKHDKESEKKGINLIKYYLSKKVIQIILIIIVIAAVIFGVSNYFKTEILPSRLLKVNISIVMILQ